MTLDPKIAEGPTIWVADSGGNRGKSKTFGGKGGRRKYARILSAATRDPKVGQGTLHAASGLRVLGERAQHLFKVARIPGYESIDLKAGGPQHPSKS